MQEGNKSPKIAVIAIVITVIAAGSLFVYWKKRASDKQTTKTAENGKGVKSARRIELETKVWPAETKIAIDKINHLQATDLTTNAQAIDLSSYVNVALTDSVASPKSVKDNNLAELPIGEHLYGGVPFNVQGEIQLMGKGLLQFGKKYPIHVNDIRISKRCNRLHIFHGSSFINQKAPGATIAKLVLHYADGSASDLDIVSGQHVLDWWAPIFTTTVKPEHASTKAAGTDLAWAGSNPWIKKWQPDWSLRLYKSTFSNPKPQSEIATIDYVSTLTDAAPFLIALTVD